MEPNANSALIFKEKFLKYCSVSLSLCPFILTDISEESLRSQVQGKALTLKASQLCMARGTAGDSLYHVSYCTVINYVTYYISCII